MAHMKLKWHENVVNRGVINAAARLSEVLNDGFYMAGGTALALQLGHRISLDLDLFSAENLLQDKQRRMILESLKASGNIKIKEISDGTCHFQLDDISISLFHYPYPLIEKSIRAWRGIAVASLGDIAAMKLSAVLGRGSKKDFLDLYWLSQTIGLDRILDFGAVKFADHSNFIIQTCRALVYFEDAENEPMPRQLKKVEWNTVKRFFDRKIPKLLHVRLQQGARHLLVERRVRKGGRRRRRLL